MLNVQTYIFFPITQHKFTSFPTRIPVDDTATLRRAKPFLNLDRFEGYIELTYYGQPILTHILGDFIIDYWCYLVEALEDYIKKGSGRMYLPDQPIPIEFEEQGSNWVLMTVGEAGEYGKWLLPREELIKTLIEGAVHFFKGIYDAFGDDIIRQNYFKGLLEEFSDIKKQYLGDYKLFQKHDLPM